MEKKDLANKLRFIPIANLFFLWYYTKRVPNFFEFMAVALTGFAATFVFSKINPFIPETVDSILFFIEFYAIETGMVLTARQLNFRRVKKQEKSSL